MALTDRVPYQALIDRPRLVLPGGKKLAVWIILNVEEWRIENAMPLTVLSPPMGQPLLPDVPNWAWHAAVGPKRINELPSLSECHTTDCLKLRVPHRL